MLSKVPLLGVSITVSSKETILCSIQEFLSKKKSDNTFGANLTIVTPNPEQIMLAQKNSEFRAIVNAADVALPDGAGVVWALKNRSKIERISGIDFMEELCAMAAKKNWAVAFIGGRHGVAKSAFINLQKKYPGLKGFADDGPFMESQDVPRDYVEKLANWIKEYTIRLVFVGLGAPKQEYFIHQLLSSSTSMVMMSVGGSFDVFAGKIKRAPKSVQKLGFEWLWRLFHEPWRIRRQIALLKFIVFVCMNARS